MLADIKTTSKLDKEYVSWQLSVYADWFEAMNPDIPVKALYVVWLKDDKHKVIEVERKSHEEVEALLYGEVELAKEDYTPGDLPEVAGIEEQIAELTNLIMLFFARFKEGKYGRFYGAVDPLIITNALNDFDHERIAFIDKYEQTQRANRPPKEGCITREEFDKLEFVDVPIIILRRDENFMNYFIRPSHATVTVNGKATVKIKKTEFEALDAWCKAGYIRIYHPYD